MEDDLVPIEEFKVPVIEVSVKKKKAEKGYKQYMIKLPKEFVTLLRLSKGCFFKFKVYPVDKKGDYPKFDMEVIRDGKTKA